MIFIHIKNFLQEHTGNRGCTWRVSERPRTFLSLVVSVVPRATDKVRDYCAASVGSKRFRRRCSVNCRTSEAVALLRREESITTVRLGMWVEVSKYSAEVLHSSSFGTNEREGKQLSVNKRSADTP